MDVYFKYDKQSLHFEKLNTKLLKTMLRVSTSIRNSYTG